MNKEERFSITMEEMLEEARKYSSSQRKELIEELETDVQNLARSMANLYDEHTGVFLMYGVQVEVKFSVFNEVAYRQVLGCPEVYAQMAEKAKQFMEEHNDQRAKTGD